MTFFGTAETGPIPTEVTDTDDWGYSRFSSVLPHRLEHVFEGLYELVIVREGDGVGTGGSTNVGVISAEPVFCYLPELTEYHTKDLFSKQPSRLAFGPTRVGEMT